LFDHHFAEAVSFCFFAIRPYLGLFAPQFSGTDLTDADEFLTPDNLHDQDRIVDDDEPISAKTAEDLLTPDRLK